MRAKWITQDKQVWGDLKLDDQLCFMEGEWPFKKQAWNIPYHQIEAVEPVDAKLYYNTAYFAADYTFRIKVKDQPDQIFSLVGPGHYFAKNFIHNYGYDETLGARPMRRIIRKHVEEPFLEKIFAGEINEGDVVYIRWDKQKDCLTFNPKSK